MGPTTHRAERSPSSRGAAIALGAVVVLATVVYGAVAQLPVAPRVNPDELRYALAARELVAGDWLNLRGEDYGFGAVYPAVLAPILALSDSLEAAYPYYKLANALLFALAAVPIFFVARRLLSPWWSVAVAAMSIAIPSSIYTSLVMTECASYLTSSLALLAIVLALERPSPSRQLAMVGAVALAYATRPQFATLLLAYVGAYVLLWAVDVGRPRLREAAARLWPTLSALGLGTAALLGRPLLTGSSPEQSLGAYWQLWRGYDLVSVTRWAVYHLAGLELYLFVVPFAVAPIVLTGLLRAARRRAPKEGAFAAAFLTVNAIFLVVAAAFSSTPWGYDRLHERYLFYVAPLWLIVFGVWLSKGLPRPFAPTTIGVLLALALPAILPFGLIADDTVYDVVPSALWSAAWSFLDGYPLVDGTRALAATVVTLTVATAALPRRLWPLFPAVVVAGFLLTQTLAWQREVDQAEQVEVAEDPNPSWVDDAVLDGSRAVKVYVSSPGCPNAGLAHDAFFLTEFFNDSVDRAASIGDAITDGLPFDRVGIGTGGRVVRKGGRPLVADYVVTQQGVELDGRRVTEGTGAGLVLWETDGKVRLADGARTEDLSSAGCN